MDCSLRSDGETSESKRSSLIRVERQLKQSCVSGRRGRLYSQAGSFFSCRWSKNFDFSSPFTDNSLYCNGLRRVWQVFTADFVRCSVIAGADIRGKPLCERMCDRTRGVSLFGRYRAVAFASARGFHTVRVLRRG